MANFWIIEGQPGQGKSLYMADLMIKTLERNVKIFKKTGLKRRILSNLKLAEEIEKKYHGFIDYWTDSQQLCKERDCDIFWDEIATELDARNFANLSTELKRFLSQYRKRGIDIYANTQDFSMIDARARLMISNVRTLTKILGSRDISTTKPAPKHIWGLVLIRDVQNFKETEPEKKKYEILPSFMLIEKSLVEIYDTRQDIPVGKAPPLKHEIRYCEKHHEHGGEGCDYKKITHN